MASGGDGDKNPGFSNLHVQTALFTAVTNVFANMQSSSSRSNDSGPSSSKASTRATVTHTSDDDNFEQCAKRFRKYVKFSFMGVANNVRHSMLFLELPMFENNDLIFVFRTLPSKFSRRIRNVSGTSTRKKRIYERDIILLPSHFANEDNGKKCIRIPRGEVREYLSSNNLLGKITLDSTMTQQEIFDDIRETFQKPMRNKADFDFIVLQPTGGGSKTLTVPCHSKNFEWSASSIVSKNTKTPIYLLANEDIKECTPEPKEQPPIRGASGSSPIYIADDKPPSPKIPSPLVPTYYNSYVDLVLGDESSDSSLLPSPVQPSFSPITPSDSQEDTSLHLLLQSHRSRVIRPDQTHRITVRRSHIVSDAILAVRKGFDMSSSIRITSIGEPAVDAGGPLREFFRLVMRGLVTDNSLFQGPDDCRSPAHNTIELRKGTFNIIGQLFALSIVHGGPGPQCLSHAVVDYFAYGIHKAHGTIEDVHDPLIREKINKLVDAKDTEFVDLLMSDEYDFVYSCGVAIPSSGVLKVKNEIIEGIISHYAVMLIKAELDEIAIGMEKLGVLFLLQKNPVKMRSIFIAYQFHLSADIMQDLFLIHFSPAGSNSRQKEEEVSLYWVNFLQDIEGTNGVVQTESCDFLITLEDVLAFTTGASSIPPVGFTNKPSIEFHSKSKYAQANTCGNVLKLSLLANSYEQFRDLLCFSIANSIGFGKV